MAPKACPECGSRKWRRDGVTGNAVCEDGHVYQDFRSENLVMDATGITLQKRRIRGPGRVNKRKELGQVNKDFYHGADAEWLKVQAFQLLLRMQVRALSKLWHLPDTYEMIVRDLWAYQLSMCHQPPRPVAGSTSAHEDGQKDEAEKIASKEEGDGSDGSSKSDSEGEEGIDPELLEDIENLSEDEARNREEEEGNKVAKKRPLRISDTIVCLIIGLWVLRYPLLNVDLEELINGNDIPYIDFGRTSLLPDEMKKRINRDTMLALCPGRCPSPHFLHVQSHRLARYIHLRHGVIFPEINLPPVAWSLISTLGGTPTTHAQTLRLLALIDVNLTITDTEVVKHSRRRRGRSRGSASDGSDSVTYERTKRYEDIWMPELAVAAAWVIVMKMSYGLDGEPRQALTKDDPLVGLPLGAQWVDELARKLHSGDLVPSKRFLDRVHFGSAAELEIDQFLDSAEAVLLKDRRLCSSSLTSDIAHVFPLEAPVSNVQPRGHPNWSKFHASVHPSTHRLVPGATANKDLPLLPGESIRSYRASDFTGTLPEMYETVLKAAAAVVGVRPRDVSKVVEVFERRIEKRRSGRSSSSSRSGSVSVARRHRLSVW